MELHTHSRWFCLNSLCLRPQTFCRNFSLLTFGKFGLVAASVPLSQRPPRSNFDALLDSRFCWWLPSRTNHASEAIRNRHRTHNIWAHTSTLTPQIHTRPPAPQLTHDDATTPPLPFTQLARPYHVQFIIYHVPFTQLPMTISMPMTNTYHDHDHDYLPLPPTTSPSNQPLPPSLPLLSSLPLSFYH